MTILLLISGLVLLYFGAEWLVKGSSSVALYMGIKPLIVGLTVVALGTSSPELLVSIRAALDGAGDIAVGNVIGSNICNIGLILGISALIHPMRIKPDILWIDLPMMIILTIILVVILLSGLVSFGNGVVLTTLFVLFLIITWLRAKRGQVSYVDNISADQERKNKKSVIINVALSVAGLAGLALGAHFLVRGAINAALYFEVSQAIIGLTIVAIGTSLPELATCVMASVKKRTDFIVGGIVGSNIFNTVAILGITALIHPIYVTDITMIDMGVMIGLSIIILPLMWTGFRLSRTEGAFLVVIYIAYMWSLI